MDSNQGAEYKKKYFNFNLLPGITEAKIERLERRDNTTLSGLVLVFAALLLFFLLNIVEIGLIKTRINSLDGTIKDNENSMAVYQGERVSHGEIVRKSILLANTLDKDIDISNFLNIADSVVQNNGVITSYQREETGEFTITVKTTTYEVISNIMSNIRDNSNVENPYLSSVTTEDSNLSEYLTTIQFSIIQDGTTE